MDKDRSISKHLKWSEIRCRGNGCCDGGGITSETADLFEMIRAQVAAALGAEVPIYVTSGYRCYTHNKAVGGVKASQHMRGIALDLDCPEGMEYETFYHICDALNPDGGVGKYPRHGFVHVDVRGKEARWDG